MYLIQSFAVLCALISITAQAQELPALVGPYPVGLSHQEFIDQDFGRPFVVYLFYPSLKGSEKKATLEYFGPWRTERKEAWRNMFLGHPYIDIDWTLSFLEHVSTSVPLNSRPMAKTISRPFPVLIFAPGSTGVIQDYAFFLEQIASMGIIVVAAERPVAEGIDKILYLPSQDKYLIYPWTSISDSLEDGEYAANILKKTYDELSHIAEKSAIIYDKKKVIIAGHSLGGHGAWRASQRSSGVFAFLNLDGDVSFQTSDNLDYSGKFFLLKIGTRSNAGPDIDETVLATMKNLNTFIIKEGMDHGSVGNTPFLVDYSPSGKGYFFAQEHNGLRKNASETYSILAKYIYDLFK